MTETGQWSRNVDWRTRWRAEQDAPAQAAPVEISMMMKQSVRSEVKRGSNALQVLVYYSYGLLKDTL